MSVDRNILNEFIKMTKDEPKPRETKSYGTIVTDGESKYVKMDGSDVLTPISTVTDIAEGERVIVEVKNHTATVTGNMSDPSAGGNRVEAAEGKIGEFDHIFAGNITADNIHAGAVTADKILANSITTDKIYAEAVTAGKIAADSIYAGHIVAEQIEAEHIKAGVIEAEHIKAESITADQIAAGSVTSDRLTVSDGFITDAMIDTLKASKIIGGKINTNEVEIGNDRIVIADSTQQFRDANGNVRIQMGEDAQGDFNFIVRAEDGQTTLIDGTGVKEGAIADGLIKDKMIGEGEIGGTKIDWDSFADSFNADTNTNTLTGSKIYLDTKEQTLEIAFSKMENDLGTSADKLKIYYGKSNSTSIIPHEWFETSPQWEEGTYIWMKTETVKNNGTIVSSDPVCIQGAKGEDGQNGLPGEQGPAGIPGIQGPAGPSGASTYTWIKYADDHTGVGMSDYPDGKKYLGMANNKPTAEESSRPTDYTWSLIKGVDGIPGAAGADGKTYYTWIKYADTPTSGMSDNPTNKKYIGLAVNKTTTTESSNYNDYNWSLIKGADGSPGAPGQNGVGVSSITPQYALSDSKTVAPTTGWVDTPPSASTGKYIWTRSKILLTNNTTVYSTPVFDTNLDVLHTEIKTINGEISTLVSNTTITESGEDITIKEAHSNLKQTVSGLSSTVTSHTSQISGMNSKITSNTSSITQMEKEIALKVEQTDINNSINNITVGGRNLFKGHKLNQEIVLNDYNNGAASFTQFTNNYFTFDPAKFVGKEFTISLYAKSPKGTTQLRIYNQNGDPRYFYFTTVVDNALGNEWKYYTYTFTNNDIGPSYTPSTKLEIYAPHKNGVIVKNIKIEMGNKATDWTAAHEDVDGAITETNKKVAEIRTDLNSITSRVTSSEQRTTTLEKTTEKISINNFSRTGNVERWSIQGGYSLVDDATVGKHLKSTTNTNVMHTTARFDIDPNKTYKVSVMQQHIGPEIGTFYFGVYAYDKSGNQIGVYLNTLTTLDTNPYFHYERASSSNVNKWRTFDGYIYAHNTPVDSNTPKGTTGNFMRFDPKTKQLAIRILNYRTGSYGDGKNGSMGFAHPIISEVDGIIANNATRLKSAEQKITADAITNTVTSSASWSTQNGKITDAKNTATNAYNIASSVKQTADSLEISFKANANNVNLLPNSNPKKRNEKDWTIGGGGNAGFYHGTSHADWAGLQSKNTTTEVYAYSPPALLDGGGDYSISCFMEKEVNIESADIYLIGSHNENLATDWSSAIVTNVTSGSFARYKKTVSIPSNVKYLRIRFDANKCKNTQAGYVVWFGECMIIKGKDIFPTKWFPAGNEISNGITVIDKDGITVSMSDGDGTRGHSKIDYEGLSIYDNTGKRKAWFGEGNAAQIDELTVVSKVNNPHLIQNGTSKGRGHQFYIGPNATGDGSGRDTNNLSNSINHTLNWIKNTYGVYSFKQDIQIFINNGTYYEDIYVGGWIGTGMINLNFDGNAVWYGNHTFEENSMYIRINGRRSNVDQWVNDGCRFIYRGSRGSLFVVRASKVYIRDLRAEKEGWSGSVGVWNGYEHNFIHAYGGGEVHLRNSDIIGFYRLFIASDGSHVTTFKNRGHCVFRGESREGTWSKTHWYVPLHQSGVKLDSCGNHLDLWDVKGENSAWKSKNNPPQPPPPSWKWFENSFTLTGLRTRTEGSGSSTSNREGEWGQGCWGAYKAHRGYADMGNGPSDWCRGGRNFTVWLTLHRVNSGGYAGAVPKPKLKKPNGSFWDCGVAFARNDTKTIQLTGEIAGAIANGSMKTLEMWAGRSENDYSMYDKATIKIKCEKQV